MATALKDELLTKIKNQKATVAVIGMGYVGLPLIINFGKQGYKTLGLDIDGRKIDALNKGESYIQHIEAAGIKALRDSGHLEPSSDMSRVAEADAIIICVPTPLDHHHEPDLSYVVSTVDSIVPHLRKGQVVSLESTTYPGTTEEELRPRIEKSGFKVGEDFFLCFSPEREDPGNEHFRSEQIPKIVGGTTAACHEVGCALYHAVCEAVVPVTSTQVAEFAKLLENIYRAVNIGLVNEMKLVADKMGIDIWEVINAAATKPFGFKAFYPGPGLGGHCIPIDPFYLTWKAKEYGIHTRFIELAGEINESMPAYVVQRVGEALNKRRKPLNGSKVLVMGLAYKENVDDMRESPTFKLFDLLKEQGAEVSYYDPHIPVITPTREHAAWTGHKSIAWSESTVRGFDCVLISTKHRAFDLNELVAWADCIVDTRNALVEHTGKPGQIVKA
jgi:UDP-N-acetyl-D-glucosamine dehydrogenase